MKTGVYTLKKVYEVYIGEVFERVWKVFEESQSRTTQLTRTWNTRATSVRSALYLLLGVCVGGFVGMVVLGCGKQVLGVRAAKTTIERV